MEEITKLIYKGDVKSFENWFEIMIGRYPEATIEAVLEDFKTTE